MRGRRVTQRHQLASFVYADGKSLLGAGALAGGIEHLRTGESQLHRSLDLFRRRRGEQRVAPLKSLRAEGATYEWTNDAHIFLWAFVTERHHRWLGLVSYPDHRRCVRGLFIFFCHDDTEMLPGIVNLVV